LPGSHKWDTGVWFLLSLLLFLTFGCSNVIKAKATIWIDTSPPPVALTNIPTMDVKKIEAAANHAEAAAGMAERAIRKTEAAAQKAALVAKKAEQAAVKADTAAHKVEGLLLISIKK
jgi:hypothetical protein